MGIENSEATRRDLIKTIKMRDNAVRIGRTGERGEIGRASCRERVCQYV